MFISISSALVVLATEEVVLEIVGIVVVIVVAIEAMVDVVVDVIMYKYCIFGQSIISFIISWKL